MTPLALLNEPARLHALHSTGLLEGGLDPGFDRFARLAARLAAAPIALITLVGEDRQVVRGAAGVQDSDPLLDLPIGDAFCPYAVVSGEPLVIPDALGHPLVGDSRPVRELGIRAYLGVPLRSESGVALGALCALDRRPRAWTDDDVAALRDLAGAVEARIALRHATRSAERAAERLAEAQGIARLGSWQWERATDRVVWSDNLYEILGFPHGAPPGHEEFLAHVHPDDRAQVERAIDDAFIRHAAGYEYECRFLRPDGATCRLLVRADIGFDDRDEAVRSSGIAQDVTELRESQRELEITAHRLEEAQALAQIGSWDWEAGGGYHWSEQLYRIYGIDPARGPLSFSEFLARIHPDDRDRVEQIVRGLEPQERQDYECRIFRPDGSIRTIHILGEFVFDEKGNPVRGSGTTQDVTERRETLERLEEAESLAGVGSWEWEVGTPAGNWSPQLYRIFGVSPDTFDPSWENALARCHPDDREAAAALLEQALEDLDALDVTTRIHRPAGELRWVRVRAEVLRDASGAPLRMVGTVQDLTEAKRAELSLREAEERFGSTFDESEVGMALLDPRMSRFLRVNRALCELLQRDEDELLATPPTDLLHPDEPRLDPQSLRDALNDARSLNGERRYLRADGETVHASMGVTLISDESGEPLYFVIRARDLTDQRRAEEQLRYQALHSPLTGLPNRALFLDRLNQALRQRERRASTVAVMAVDIDRFSAVNERFGLGAGDEALAAVGARLASRVRPTDTVAHLGGDEFLVLCEDLPDEHEALALAGRLASAVSEPLPAGRAELALTASIGVVLASDGHGSAEDLIRDAESAMSGAHARGGGTWEIFDPSLRARLVERLELEHELRRALENDELRLHFQPVRGLDGRAPDGAEALVRWEHPDRGLLLPAAFLPMAEETGLIVPIGNWVFREACRQAAEWGDAVPKVAVNVSARQLDAPGFVDEVAAALDASGANPAQIVIELTETGLMASASPADILAGLKALGVQIVLDDFGTGYSSLSHLRSFPVDGLKIDRSFVVDVAVCDQAQRIVEAIVGIGSALDILVVAEGVETEGQLEAVTRLGCDAVQGFLLGRPAPATAIPFARRR